MTGRPAASVEREPGGSAIATGTRPAERSTRRTDRRGISLESPDAVPANEMRQRAEQPTQAITTLAAFLRARAVSVALRARPGPTVIPDTEMAGGLVSVAPAPCDAAAVGAASVELADHTKVTAVEAPW